MLTDIRQKFAMTSRLFRGSARLNFALDVLLTAAFAVALEYHFTGLRLHELLGVAFGLALIIHLVLHLDWVWTMTKTFFRTLIHESRLNYALNVVLFIDAVVMVASGIFISRTLGVVFTVNRFLGLSWERVHILSAELSLILIALHVGMHWKWIAVTAQNSLFRRGRGVKTSAETPLEG